MPSKSLNYSVPEDRDSTMNLFIFLPNTYYSIVAMAKSGPLVIVEDDKDDQDFIQEVLQELDTPNELIFFTRCNAAFDYLKSTTDSVFLILCDINLPGISGLDFKRQIDADPELRQKSIPFVFLSTTSNKEIVKEAYTTMTVQGFFKKKESMRDAKYALSLILEYWRLCDHPNSD